MKALMFLAAVAMSSSLVSTAVAEEKSELTPSKEIIESISAGLRKGRPEFAKDEPKLQFSDFKTTPMPGIYQLRVDNGPRIYTDVTGSHFIMGEIYQVAPKQGFVNLVELERVVERKELMSAIPVDTMITYPAEGKEKGRINVFTDVNCGYCRKFHKNVLPALNKMGVSVSYYAYPVIGKQKSHKQMMSAWCADDREAALADLKGGKSIEEKSCDKHPIDIHLQLGNALEVRGTPSIYLPDGEQIQLGAAMMPSIKRAFGIKD